MVVIWVEVGYSQFVYHEVGASMNNLEYSQVLARVKQISIESRGFIEECEMRILEAKRLCDHVAWSLEEAMILKEESIATKCESLAILKLSNQSTKKQANAGCVHFSADIGIDDDTSIALQMLGEINQASIPDENPTLHALRSRLFGLSFLPDFLE